MRKFFVPAIVGLALAIGTVPAFAATEIQAAVVAALEKIGFKPVPSKVVGGPAKLKAPKGTKIKGKEVDEVTVTAKGEVLGPGEKDPDEEAGDK
jgi:hypothetical protein